MISHKSTQPVSASLSYGTNRVTRRICLVLAVAGAALALAVAGAALAQDANQPQKEAPPKKEEPAPLFGGKLGTRSSQKTRESATLGFNGIDPSGKVDQQMLATPANSTHETKVRQMAALAPTPADLEAFLKEGGLNKR
jgi:hypothetical protein